jgi:hypothetical protein
MMERENAIRDIEKTEDATPKRKKEMEAYLKNVREEVKSGTSTPKS